MTSDGYWTGDKWRWNMSAPSSLRTIYAIEPADSVTAAARSNARTVPFGFGPRDEIVSVEPLLWEGDDS